MKGYEIDKNRWVVREDQEIKKVAPPSTDTMEITEFVDASYYAVPEEPGRKAYHLLVDTMEKERLCGAGRRWPCISANT